MSASWDLPGTPLHSLHTLHREKMAAYRLVNRAESLFGGQCPQEVVHRGRYISLKVGEDEEWDRGETDGSECLQSALTAALSQNQDSAEALKILVVGPPGVGKTTAIQKLLLDWASEERLAHFAFVLPLPLRDLRSMSGEQSLADLLSQQHPHLPSDALPLVLQNPQALLFVLDGLEQNQDGDAPPCTDPNQSAPLSAIVSGLLQSTLLPGASILATSRPSQSLEPTFDRKAKRLQVQGLSEEGRGEFVRQFFANTEGVAEIQEHMEEMMGFCAFARLPGFCWTLCSVYRAAREAKQGLPKTLTSVFIRATASVIQRHTLEMKQAVTLLSGLGKMADHVILGEANYCLQVEMTSFGLQPFLAASVLRDFLHVSEHSFSFLSPMLAQFLLAVAYHRGLWDGNLADLLKLAVKKAPLLELFLAGLCDPSQCVPLEGLVGKFDSSRAQEFRAWLQNITQEVVPSYDRKRHLHCFRLLHQCQDSALTKAAIGPSTALGMSYGGLSAQDAVALTYVAMSLGALQQLNLYNSKNLSERVMRHLVPVIGVAEKLILSQSTLTTGSFPHLSAGLQRGMVRELDLSYCHMGNRGVQSLCAGLGGSGVQILRLYNCKLTEEDCDHLAPVLCTSRLHMLDLSANDFKDAGLLKLCLSLSNPQCQLQEIGLKMCGLTGSSVEALSTALRCGSSVLRSLDLDRNPLGDKGADWISTALRDPQCNLQSLILYGCELTDACCAGLADAFRTSGRVLTELDLSVNELGDQGVLQLIDAFKAANCVPQKLRLNRCELGLQAFEVLAEVLRMKESGLRELEVGSNEVGDAGAKLLWSALQDPHCKLEHLDVEMLGLTDECVPELCAAVRASSSLKGLVLKNNGLTDATVPALVAMAQASRTLRELNVQYNDYSEDVFELMDTCGKIRY